MSKIINDEKKVPITVIPATGVTQENETKQKIEKTSSGLQESNASMSIVNKEP
jgi:hypothetical protein